MNAQKKIQHRSLSTAQMGTIVIVDISGYTRFVRQVDAAIGVGVISRLLDTLLRSNNLGFSLSEIEGDAILFYRYGEAPAAINIRQQFERMLAAFSREVKRISAKVPEAGSLSVKLVATYGALMTFSLGGFRKLYGRAVIKAHRLLKNNIDSGTYVLIEEELLSPQEVENCEAAAVSKMCEMYDLGPVCYRYLAYPSYDISQSPMFDQQQQDAIIN